MAFHVACPITCKRICSCTLGFPRKLQSDTGRNEFLEEILKIDEFLTDPWLIRVKDKATVQVPVPKVAPPPTPPTISVADADGGVTNGAAVGVGAAAAAAADELLLASSAQTKRVALQKKAAVASLAAEDFARRFETGTLLDAPTDTAGEEQVVSGSNVMCRICFSGENEGTEKARRMLPCKSCGKKYHRNCLKTWSQNRDLFHWSSWTCPSCRICEVCRRTGDPNKFKFCRRCDAAYHCYCMQPPHKNVSSGPYLCPKHTRCHSCGSNVPGNGLSVRWFLGYTCCDACGRLFTKGNYCPVCLKVYRDSESTPMVCCDICQRWVHCQCDAISDEKYLQFQVDGNLPYTCPTCRGECYQVKDIEDAVRELWRRKDEADHDLIASLRAAAGLPTEEEIFSISPFSDDEDNGPFMLKNEYGRMKFSLKGSADGSPKKIREIGKKSSSKKHVKKKGDQTLLSGKIEFNENFEGDQDAQFSGYGSPNKKSALSYNKSRPDAGTTSHTERICSINQQEVLKNKFMNEITGDNQRGPGVSQIKSKVTNDDCTHEEVGKVAGKPQMMKGTKLVIHLGGRNRNITNSSKSDSSSHQREQEMATCNGSEAMSQHRGGDRFSVDKLDGTACINDGYKVDSSHEFRGLKHRERENSLIRLGKGKHEVSGLQPKYDRGDQACCNGLISPESAHVSSARSNEGSAAATADQGIASKFTKASLRKHPVAKSDVAGESNKKYSQASSVPYETPKDPKPLLRLKFKNPYQGSWSSHGNEEKAFVKGQRSKRKRPSPIRDKSKLHEDDVESQRDDIMSEFMDASWILKKLGRDAIGKRVEVHQQSDNSWHKGVVSDVTEGTPMLNVDLDDGRSKKLELGNHGIRFVPQKQKRQKT